MNSTSYPRRLAVLWAILVLVALAAAASRGAVLEAALLGAATGTIGVALGRIMRARPAQIIGSCAIIVSAAALLSATRVTDSVADWCRVIEVHGALLARATLRSMLLSAIALLVAYGVARISIAAVLKYNVWERTPPGLAWIFQAVPIVLVCAAIDIAIGGDTPLVKWTKITITCASLYLYPTIAFAFEGFRRLPEEQGLQLRMWGAGGDIKYSIYAGVLSLEALAGLKVSASWAVGAEVVSEYYFAQGYPMDVPTPLLGQMFKTVGKNEAGGLFILCVFCVLASAVVWFAAWGAHRRKKNALYPRLETTGTSPVEFSEWPDDVST